MAIAVGINNISMTIAYGNQAKYGATAADAATKYQIENDDIRWSTLEWHSQNRIESKYT